MASQDIDINVLKDIVKKFLGTGTFTVQKGRFPVKLPKFTDSLWEKVKESFKEYQKAEETGLLNPGLVVNLGELHYRLDDISGATAEMRTKALSTFELGIVGYTSFRSVDMFQYQVNTAIEDILRLYVKKGDKINLSLDIGVGWEADEDNPTNLRRGLDFFVFTWS